MIGRIFNRPGSGYIHFHSCFSLTPHMLPVPRVIGKVPFMLSCMALYSHATMVSEPAQWVVEIFLEAIPTLEWLATL